MKFKHPIRCLACDGDGGGRAENDVCGVCSGRGEVELSGDNYDEYVTWLEDERDELLKRLSRCATS